MLRKRIAVACQGGGSQCAFVAGALKTLLAQDVQSRYQVVGLSGTSGGAITAALAWVGLLKQSQGDPTPIEDRIMGFWRDLTAQTPREVLFDGLCVNLLRLVEQGLLPSVAMSPSSPQFRLWSKAAATFIARPEFTDLRALLVKHLDLSALPSLLEPDSPVLLIAAADVIEGTFKTFSSVNGEINLEALLASAAVPNLFPAVHVDGHAYWDGIFSQNPPVAGFLQRAYMGKDLLPEEIWIIQVNRSKHASVPERQADIVDRRNHMAGNLSLRHELQLIEIVNLLLQEHALTGRFRARFGFETTEPIKVRFIRMSEDLQNGLDYPSKLSRQPFFIRKLVADGIAQASAFLAALQEADSPPERAVREMPIEIH